MRYGIIAISALALNGCSPAGSVDGKLVDGLSGETITEGRVLLKSSDTTDMTCMTIEAPIAADGTFSAAGTCAGATYSIVLPKELEHLKLADQSISGGEPVSLGDLTVWNAPGDGVYSLGGDNAQLIRTAADLDTVTIWETDIEVKYPKKLPGKVPLITGDSYLLIAGKANVEKLKFHPLSKSDKELRFGEADHYFDMQPWYYIGVTFESKSEYEMLSVTVDDAAVTKAMVGDFEVMYLTEKALPPGRYALLGDNDKRTYIVDFGTAPAASDKPKKEEG